MIVDANRTAGRRISETRSMLGITQEALADRIEIMTGIRISADALGRYERGERSISLDTLVAVAIGLDVPVQQLIDGADPRNGVQTETKNPMKRLTPEEHAIYRYLATDWDGDRRALIISDAIYAALPKRRRADVIISMMVQVSEALAVGEISPKDLPDGLSYMEQKTGELLEDGA